MTAPSSGAPSAASARALSTRRISAETSIGVTARRRADGEAHDACSPSPPGANTYGVELARRLGVARPAPHEALHRGDRVARERRRAAVARVGADDDVAVGGVVDDRRHDRLAVVVGEADGLAVLDHGDERVRRAEVDADGARPGVQALDARLPRLGDLKERLSHGRRSGLVARVVVRERPRRGSAGSSAARSGSARRRRKRSGVPPSRRRGDARAIAAAARAAHRLAHARDLAASSPPAARVGQLLAQLEDLHEERRRAPRPAVLERAPPSSPPILRRRARAGTRRAAAAPSAPATPR